MLYITTRNQIDTYTANRALREDVAPDGGRFVPFRLPVYTADEIVQLGEKSFGQTVADVLNMFFSSRLTAWEIDCLVGRNATRILSMNHRVVIAELWHNIEGKFSYIEQMVQNTISGDRNGNGCSDWVRIATRIAVLFGIYGEMLQRDILQPGEAIDISLPNDDLTTPMAALYCRAMGLPINRILCCCEENGNLWDFLQHGVVSPASFSQPLQLGVERLLQATLGCKEADRFSGAGKERKTYKIEDDDVPVLKGALFCTVAGNDRISNTVNSVFRSNSCIIDPVAALCYSGLQDYRAKTGESGLTLILSNQTPMDYTKDICTATGLSPEKLYEYVSRG